METLSNITADQFLWTGLITYVMGLTFRSTALLGGGIAIMFMAAMMFGGF